MANLDGFDRLISVARATNRKRDALDRENGFAAPTDYASGCIETALAALECAIRMQSWDCAAESYVLLEMFVLKFRKATQ